MRHAQTLDRFQTSLEMAGTSESFQIISADGTNLGSIYYEDEPGRRRVMNRLTREEARQFAVQIVRFPEILDELEKLRAARDEPA
jgi:hypothetical protein